MDSQRGFGQLRPPSEVEVASYGMKFGWNIGTTEVAELTKQADRAFGEFDLLTTPTILEVAHLLADRLSAGDLVADRIGSATRHTAPLDITGHPALTVSGDTAEDDMPTGSADHRSALR